MSSLETLIRLHRWQLDERRGKVVELQGLLEKTCGDLAALETDLAREGEVAGQSFHAAVAYPAYAAVMLTRRGKLQVNIAEFEGALAQARLEIMEAYRSLKKHEQLRRNHLTREKAKAARRAQGLLDDQSIDRYRRAAAASRS